MSLLEPQSNLKQVTSTLNIEFGRRTDILAGAFFIWIIYAIGARLIPDPENSTEVGDQWPQSKPELTVAGIFRSRADVSPGRHVFTRHKHSAGSSLSCTVLLQSPDRVSNLVCSTLCFPNQYAYDDMTRHLVGLVLRLCVKLRYHRKLANSPESRVLDPYIMELRKRFFWCAYCFDRCVSLSLETFLAN